MSGQANPNVQVNPSESIELVPTGPKGPPQRRTWAKVVSISFCTILVLELFIIFITMCVQANIGGIVGSLIGLAICVFIYIDVCSDFQTWYILLFWLKLVAWGVTTSFICVTLAFIIYLNVNVTNAQSESDKFHYTIYLVLLVIFLPLGYAFYAAALFPAIHLYDFELRPITFSRPPIGIVTEGSVSFPKVLTSVPMQLPRHLHPSYENFQYKAGGSAALPPSTVQMTVPTTQRQLVAHSQASTYEAGQKSSPPPFLRSPTPQGTSSTNNYLPVR